MFLPMDFFDFIPIVPPGMPGDSPERSPGHQFASGVGSVLLPMINFIVVLAAGFAHSGTVALVVLPLVSGGILYVVARLLSVGVAWGIALAMFCATFCFVANGVALFIAGLANFFQTF
jgi:hypothetical protein